MGWIGSEMSQRWRGKWKLDERNRNLSTMKVFYLYRDWNSERKFMTLRKTYTGYNFTTWAIHFLMFHWKAASCTAVRFSRKRKIAMPE